MSPKFNHF